MARGKHLFPFRTEQLSPSAPMVLGLHGPGRVGRRRFFLRAAFWAARRRSAPEQRADRRDLGGAEPAEPRRGLLGGELLGRRDGERLAPRLAAASRAAGWA